MEPADEVDKRHILGRPAVYDVGLWGIGYLPRKVAYMFAETVAAASYLFYGKVRKNVERNLEMVLPGATPSEISSLALKTFRNYSKYLVDYGRHKALDRDTLFRELASIEGTENIEAALRRGKGLILLTAHLGNWELGGIFFGKQDIKINVITARDGVARVDEIREKYRKDHSINTIILDDSPFAGVEVASALARNEVVAMLVDRSVKDGVRVPFFTGELSFPAGPILLARATGAAIMPGFVVREKGGYRAVAEKLIFCDRSDGESLEAAARRILEVFERYIRTYPDQWYNFVPV